MISSLILLLMVCFGSSGVRCSEEEFVEPKHLCLNIMDRNKVEISQLHNNVGNYCTQHCNILFVDPMYRGPDLDLFFWGKFVELQKNFSNFLAQFFYGSMNLEEKESLLRGNESCIKELICNLPGQTKPLRREICQKLISCGREDFQKYLRFASLIHCIGKIFLRLGQHDNTGFSEQDNAIFYIDSAFYICEYLNKNNEYQKIYLLDKLTTENIQHYLECLSEKQESTRLKFLKSYLETNWGIVFEHKKELSKEDQKEQERFIEELIRNRRKQFDNYVPEEKEF